jgi:hypothetical protein
MKQKSKRIKQTGEIAGNPLKGQHCLAANKQEWISKGWGHFSAVEALRRS